MSEDHQIIHVHIGEAKLGEPHSVLKTILGSCVGIGLIWRSQKKVALAHCLLPEGHSLQLNAKYVNQAVGSLLELMEVSSLHWHELEAVIAGGANMYQEIGKASFRVGHFNSLAAIKHLDEKKIKIIHQDLGKEFGRQLILHVDTFEFEVRILADVQRKKA